MKREIGGYLEQEIYYGKEFHKLAYRVNSVRNALLLFMKSKGYKKIYIPILLCDSVYKKLKEEHIEYDLYHIDENYMPLFSSKKIQKNEVILIVNYYGIFKDNDILYFKNKYKNIIVDNTQNFFVTYQKNINAVYNCRKYFGVTDGAYIYCNGKEIKKEYNKLEKDYSADRYLYLLGRLENSAAEYYDLFRSSEKKIENMPLRKMSTATANILRSLNYKKIYRIRKRNFEYLDKKLKSKFYSNKNKFAKGTFMYPLMVEEPNEIREKLLINKIYVPVFWQEVLKEGGANIYEYRFVKNIIPLPIDQRYSLKDMEYIVSMIK